MAQTILGRQEEKRELERLYQSGRPEFVAVYGRRRVGKTFLVRELFGQRLCFYHTGLSPSELDAGQLKEQQLREFHRSLIAWGGHPTSVPSDWFEAFDALRQLVLSRPRGQRKVLFIDEMPWMDTPRSGFVTALEHFWNGWAAGQAQVMLIVCGSATSWMANNLINNYGGLYNRLTAEIHLRPFTLAECEAYYKANLLMFDRYDQIQSYMVFGGVPYYLSLLQKGKSLAQNIDLLFFADNAKLRNEFTRLYRSLFRNADDCMTVIRLLARRREGYTRKEIAEATKLPYGGGLTATLRSLEESDLIVSYIPYHASQRQTTYRLTDFFSIFHLTFLDRHKTSNAHFWKDNVGGQQLTAWRGFSFEGVCFAHIDKIKQALGISGVQTEVSAWRGDEAQIDMIIDRQDRVVNLCEIKFCTDTFSIDRSYDAVLRRKHSCLETMNGKHKSIHITMLTTYGISQNEYSGRVQAQLTMDDLF